MSVGPGGDAPNRNELRSLSGSSVRRTAAVDSGEDPLSVRIACRVYRAALRLGLDAGGQRFEQPMRQTFRALCLRRRRQGSAAAVLALAVGESLDVARHGRRKAARTGSPRGRGLAATGGPHDHRNSASRPGRGAGTLLDSLGTDLRLAGRVLRRRPGFAFAALTTLAIGIGSTTALFTVIDNVLLRPLPFPESERLVELWSWELGGADGRPGVPPALRRAWLEQTDLFEAIEVFDGSSRVLAGEGEPEQIQVTAMTHGLFELLGTRPARGRPLVAADAAPDAAAVVLLSDGLWRRRFGADPDLIGSTVRVDDTAFEVIGVMPRAFAFPDRGTDAWVALSDDVPGYPIARLTQGLDVQTAQQRADELAPMFIEAGLAEPRWGIQIFGLRDSFLFDVGERAERTLWILFGAVVLLLTIAAANVANLLLSHNTTRGHEIAVRAALGARRGRIARQLFIEAAVLALGGALLGIAFALAAVRLTTALAPDRLGFLTAHFIHVDGRVLGFALAVSLGTTLAFALLPSLQASRPGRAGALSGDRATAASGQRRLRGALVVAEVALAAVLLVGAGLLVRSLTALLRVDPGFDTAVTVVTLRPSPQRYRDEAAQRLLVDQLEQLAASLPGVQAAAVTSGAPPLFSGLSSANRAEAEGQPPALGVYRGETVSGPSQVEFLNVVNATDEYFRTMGIPLLEGRAFAPADATAAVAIISEDFARRFWHGSSPVGRRLRLREGQPWLTIVGVVGDVLQSGLDDQPGELEIYYPMAQARPGSPRLYLVLRGDIERDALMPGLRRGVRDIDPQLPIASAATMAESLSGDIAGARFNMLLLLGFAAAALLLAGVGIYGVLAYNVVRRTREIGLRVALGAGRADVVGGVVAGGMTLVLLGLGVGGLAAWALTRFMRSLLFEVEPLDPPTLAAAAVILATIALGACVVPALRAVRVDPMISLRGD
jgi:predicted permease